MSARQHWVARSLTPTKEGAAIATELNRQLADAARAIRYTIADLDDITITSVADDQFLRYDSTNAEWQNVTLTAAMVTAGAALTKSDDTNVTLALGGSPTTALLAATSLTLGWTGTLAAGRLNANVVQGVTNDTNVTGSIATQTLTLGWTGQLGVTRGGTGFASCILGDTLYGSAANTLAALAGNITTTRKFLSQTGTGAVSAAPSWVQVDAGELAGTTLAATVLTSSLTTVGALASGSIAAGFGAINNAPNTLTTGALTATTGTFSDTTDSTSSTTGSLKTAGGLGVAKAAYIGTTLNVATSAVVGDTAANFALLGLPGTGDTLWAKTRGGVVRLGDAAVQYLSRLNGTFAAPTAVLAAESVGTLYFQGYTGAAWRNMAEIRVNALEDVGATYGAGLLFNTVLTGGSTLTTRWEILGTGAFAGGYSLFVGDSANAFQTLGLTVNMGAATNEVAAFKSSTVAHGMTTNTETDTFFTITKAVAAGGASLATWRSGGTVSLQLVGISDTDNTTKTTAGTAPVAALALLKTGTTVGNCGSDANLFVIRNNATTRFIFDAEGSAHADVEWTTFDEYDDVALLRTLNVRGRDRVKTAFGGFLFAHRKALAREGIVHYYDASSPRAMVNFTRLAMLHTGAIVQMAHRFDDLETRLADITTKFNTLLSRLETHGILASA